MILICWYNIYPYQVGNRYNPWPLLQREAAQRMKHFLSSWIFPFSLNLLICHHSIKELLKLMYNLLYSNVMTFICIYIFLAVSVSNLTCRWLQNFTLHPKLLKKRWSRCCHCCALFNDSTATTPNICHLSTKYFSYF